MGNNKYKILIVEDEANIRSFIKTKTHVAPFNARLTAMFLYVFTGAETLFDFLLTFIQIGAI